MLNDLAVTDTVNALGTRESIHSLGLRIKAMIPGGNRLQDTEAMALAQISLVTGMNPFIGELWYIPGKGPMVGIRGARRVADEAIVKEGGSGAYYFLDFIPVSPEEAGALETEDVLHAYKAVLRDSVSARTYLEFLASTIKTLKDAGVEDAFGEAKEIMGKKPMWIGYGYSTKGEKTKMNKMRAAQKRAEAMALSQRFSIPFGAKMAAADSYDDTDKGEAPLAPVRSSEQMDGDFSNEVDNAFPQDDIVEGEVAKENDRPYWPEVLRSKMAFRLNAVGSGLTASKKQRGVMVGMYNEILGSDEARYEVCDYLFGRRKSSAMSHKHVIVALNHLNQDKDMAKKELQSVYQQSQKDKGQTSLFDNPPVVEEK